METPIIDFIKNYINKDITRFHMPGHKGHMFFGWEPYDITEINGADVLHHGNGIIRQSEQNASSLFGSGDTHYSTEGSTHAIKAMLCILKMEAAESQKYQKPPKHAGEPKHIEQSEHNIQPEYSTQPGHRMQPGHRTRPGRSMQPGRNMRPYILAARNVHRSMVDACALLDLDLEFIGHSSTIQYNTSLQNQQPHCKQQGIKQQALPAEGYLTHNHKQSLLSHIVTPEALERILKDKKELPLGVYVTSPDYLGQLTDIAGLSKICRQYEVPLLVDNAHGAYLHFLPEPIHPMDLGAAMCSDSAHKTLPVLTGGAYLHIHREFTERFSPYASQALSLFGSTSPSYLIMQSLDMCNRYLAEGYRERLAETVDKLQRFREKFMRRGIAVTPSEPLKLVIHTEAMGYTGEEIARELRDAQIECEYADKWQVVLMATPENSAQDWDRLERWSNRTILLKNSSLSEEEKAIHDKKKITPERAMSLREAVFSAGEWIAVELAEGRICAAETVSCPPAIPIAVSGEIISREMIQDFLNAGIHEVFVVK